MPFAAFDVSPRAFGSRQNVPFSLGRPAEKMRTARFSNASLGALSVIALPIFTFSV
jgi:hypothetical protein